MQKILNLIYAAARTSPEYPAITLIDLVVNYRMLIKGLLSVEQEILTRNFNHDSVIGISIENPAHHLTVALALAKSGFASASLMPDEIEPAKAVGMKVMISDKPVQIGGVAVHTIAPDWFIRPVDLNAWTVAPNVKNRIARVSFTSGSTGMKKAIGHTDAALKARILDRVIMTRTVGTYLCSMGLTVSAGYTNAISILIRGETICFDRTPEEAVRFLNHLNVKRIVSTPARLKSVVNLLSQQGALIDSVRHITIGGGFIDDAFLDLLKSHFTARIFEVYGSTEAGSAGYMNISKSIANGRIQSAFLPIAEVQIDEGQTKGKEGRIRIRSDSMGWPFLGDMIETNEITGDGWFYPGDIGYFDENGYLVLAGRTDDLINLGGQKFSPEKLEDIISTHPEINEVAIVKAGSSNRVEFNLCLVGSDKITKDELEKYLSSKRIDLTINRLMFLPALPRNGMGKIQRMQVAALFKSSN